MALEIRCNDIHEVIRLLEDLTGEKAHPNKVYDAIKKGRTYKGFRFAYKEDEETDYMYEKVLKKPQPIIKKKKLKKLKKGESRQISMF